MSLSPSAVGYGSLWEAKQLSTTKEALARLAAGFASLPLEEEPFGASCLPYMLNIDIHFGNLLKSSFSMALVRPYFCSWLSGNF